MMKCDLNVFYDKTDLDFECNTVGQKGDFYTTKVGKKSGVSFQVPQGNFKSFGESDSSTGTARLPLEGILIRGRFLRNRSKRRKIQVIYYGNSNLKQELYSIKIRTLTLTTVFDHNIFYNWLKFRIQNGVVLREISSSQWFSIKISDARDSYYSLVNSGENGSDKKRPSLIFILIITFLA